MTFALLLAAVLAAPPDPFKVPPEAEALPPRHAGTGHDAEGREDAPVGRSPFTPDRGPPVDPVVAERAAWLSENATRVRSIDPYDADFADLAPLAEAIGDARVVMLGEQSHGDGAVFLAKSRLIRFLHASMGFDVLVFESGVFDCREIHRALLDGSVPLEEAFERGSFTLWTRSAQVRPAMEYVAQTYREGRPLEVAGYDSQFTGGDNGATRRYVDAVRAFVAAADHPIAVRADEIAGRLESWLRSYYGLGAGPGNNRAHMENLLGIARDLDDAAAALELAHGPEEAAFMRRTIDDAVATLSSNIVFREEPDGAGQRRGLTNARDKRMAQNLVWLANERYAGRRLIVWAATFHGVHAIREIRPLSAPRQFQVTVVGGGPSKAALGDDLYTIGFEALGGVAGRAGDAPMPIGQGPPGSLGDLLGYVDHPFLFLDMRRLDEGHWLRTPLVGRLLGYEPMQAVWPDQVDGVFFTRDMIPSTLDGLNPMNLPLSVPEP